MRLTLYQHLNVDEPLVFEGPNQDAILEKLSDWLSDAEAEDVDGLCMFPVWSVQGCISFAKRDHAWEVGHPYNGQWDFFYDYDEAALAFMDMVAKDGPFESFTKESAL